MSLVIKAEERRVDGDTERELLWSTIRLSNSMIDIDTDIGAVRVIEMND